MKSALVCAFIAATTLVGNAATNSNTATVTLNAAVSESLTISLGGATTQTWTGASALTPGNATNAPSTGATTVNTTWVLQPGRTAVKLYAFFASSATALASATPAASGGVDIPTSAFEITATGTGATAGTNPVTQTTAGVGGANASLLLQSTNITGANKVNTTGLAASLTFNINLSSAAMQQLPADTYSGTLSIMAQATP